MTTIADRARPITDAGINLEDSIYRKVIIRLVPFMFLCYVCSYLNRINVSFAKIQMAQELAWSDAVYGLGAGMFFIGYFAFEIPSNIIMYRVGARRWIARIMVTWGIISAAMMFVNTPMQFYVMRFFLGVAEAGFFPAILLYLSQWFPSSRRAKVTALFMAAIPMSGVIGAPLSGWILHSLSGVQNLSGWQWLFVIEGIPTILVGVAAYLYLTDRIEDAKWLRDDEKGILRHNIDQEAAGKQLHKMMDGLANPKIWLLSFIYLFFTMGLYGVSFWLPTLIQASGVKDSLHLGLLTTIPYALATVSMIVVGRSSDRLRERRWHLAIPALLAAVGFLISTAYQTNLMISLPALCLATMGVMTTISMYWTLPPAILTGAAAATGIALANSVGSASGFISPFAMGSINAATQSTSGGIIMLSGVLIAGSILVFLLPKHLLACK
ncbi:MFS transporter [Pseudomonas syringae]|uniref:MFS transporter n=1 Tax=Pseudomonas syringae TaxID=317 RepID=UPI0018E5F22E|nr:MFS transporter [Pseudomonas syringae]MBI6750932.1 MFS transporter [Pseudomonas syringae]MBI6769251.1 MFS transporter [Pseudomonas syringae]MBI6778570.1 MFS transporter [Pseudomonas syringae]MBI6793743.1 MFS transporter [Pseudomonas syringae]MBI6804474.1 MFS transporter [Pseudomonas syringae]